MRSWPPPGPPMTVSAPPNWPDPRRRHRRRPATRHPQGRRDRSRGRDLGGAGGRRSPADRVGDRVRHAPDGVARGLETGSLRISAYTREHLKQSFGRTWWSCTTTGPTGDQSPRHHINQPDFRRGRAAGGELAGVHRVVRAACATATTASDLPWPRRSPGVDLPRRRLPSVEEAEAIAAAPTPSSSGSNAKALPGPMSAPRMRHVRRRRNVTLARQQLSGELDRMMADSLPIEVQVLRIGNAFLAGLPGESFAAYGLKLKREPAARPSWPHWSTANSRDTSSPPMPSPPVATRPTTACWTPVLAMSSSKPPRKLVEQLQKTDH